VVRPVAGSAALTATLLLASACLAAPPETRHVVVYHEPGRFAGWPANNGVWSWGDEILVGFTLGHYKADDEGHSLDKDREAQPALARSLDGGLTWRLEEPESLRTGTLVPLTAAIRFVAWMTGEPLTTRSVMPTTVRIAPDRLVSVLRRREGDRCWIDAYASDDDGGNWSFRGKVADVAGNNGNPPSLARLADGRLCVAYGTRQDPCGIAATVSRDDGRTWTAPVMLREDGRTWDLGYARTVVRTDGRLVTVSYFTTAERPEQHLVATIWEPPAP
jgi:hypothetical protein